MLNLYDFINTQVWVPYWFVVVYLIVTGVYAEFRHRQGKKVSVAYITGQVMEMQFKEGAKIGASAMMHYLHSKKYLSKKAYKDKDLPIDDMFKIDAELKAKEAVDNQQ